MRGWVQTVLTVSGASRDENKLRNRGIWEGGSWQRHRQGGTGEQAQELGRRMKLAGLGHVGLCVPVQGAWTIPWRHWGAREGFEAGREHGWT